MANQVFILLLLLIARHELDSPFLPINVLSVDVEDEQKDDNAYAAAETTRDCCVFTCKECGKTYTSWSVLRKHISNKHVDGMGK